ncbi:DUF4192 domain-containing protein [Cellulomonas sp. P22]|uniref:DUF4192 domain-containing protein n=1 Tax=Cellulomonas sp. P22 TaxID=3373189 RepID=UPI0037999A19
MDTTTLRVDEPRELLAYLPHQLGFHPHESAVAVSLRAPRGRVGLVARVDLPDLADPQGGPQVARGLVAHLGADRAARTVLVLYTDADPRGPGLDPVGARAAATHFREGAAVPLGDVPVWVVTATGYLALDCEDVRCCPVGGRPLAELESTSVGAHMVLAGSCVARSRTGVGRVRTAPADARRAVARVARRWQARQVLAEQGGAAAQVAWREQSLAAWRAAVRAVQDGAEPTRAAVLGRIEVGLTDRRVRDAVLVSMVPGTGDLAERSVRSDDPADMRAMGAAVGVIVDPQSAQPPPPGPTAAHVQTLERVVAHGRRDAQAPALTLLAMLAWWQGDGVRASILVAQARAHDPAHRLACLLDDALAAALPPGWVRSG